MIAATYTEAAAATALLCLLCYPFGRWRGVRQAERQYEQERARRVARLARRTEADMDSGLPPLTDEYEQQVAPNPPMDGK